MLRALFFFFLTFNVFVKSQTTPSTIWVDQTYESLTLDEKIGQLFMVMAFSKEDHNHHEQLKQYITKGHLGGIIFSKGTLKEQARLTNQFQQYAKIPLLIAMDAEWGMAMRLSDVDPFPYHMTLGALSNDSLIFQMGKRMAQRQKRMGVHMNFAPVVDVNTNPKNPIIGVRSFGEDPQKVAIKASLLMQGLQEGGVLASAKHFPGHGDTYEDSHKTLPLVNLSEEHINSHDLAPYKKLIQDQVAAVMVAHLNIPSIISVPNLPSSLSSEVVTDLLQTELGFEGLIVTDALNMKGVVNYDSNRSASLNAFLAGSDLLLIPINYFQAVNDLKRAFKEGLFDEKRLEKSVKKILLTKFQSGLSEYQPIDTHKIFEDINTTKDKLLFHNITESSATVIQNQDSILPIRELRNHQIAYLGLGQAKGSEFLKTLRLYTKIDEVKVEKAHFSSVMSPYETVIIGIHHSDASPWESSTILSHEIKLIKQIAKKKKVILTVFSNPYSLQKISEINAIEGVLIMYQNNTTAQSVAAQVIFGALPAHGILPVSIPHKFSVGTSIKTPRLHRLGYALPLSVQMNPKRLSVIDSFAHNAIKNSMTPGMQILVARKGKVVYNKVFGHFRYKKKQQVKAHSLYDLASLTKIMVSVPLMMKKFEENKNLLYAPLGSLIPRYNNSNKAQLTFKSMLSHQSGLQAWIPFYKQTLDSITQLPKSKFYKTRPKRKYSVQVASDIHLKNSYKDSIRRIILESPLYDSIYYKYSDLPYYILKEFVELNADKNISQQIQESIFQSMGMNLTTYNPLKKFSRYQIAPSEMDNYFRFQEIQGYVHDMGAAMQDGVGGHAGLFSNSNDVAKMMQMFLQKGQYGGKQYFRPETIAFFNQRYYEDKNNRRGIGFDKQQFADPGPTCLCASDSSFGHSGFTGTFAWVDPKYELVYVFLSNRTYPSMENSKMVETNLRSEIQRIIYQSIENFL